MKEPTLTPYPYQLKACREVYRKLIIEDHAACLLVAPTGSGKTMMSSFFIMQMIKLMNWVAMFFAHRREIIHQSALKLVQCGLWPGTIMAKELYTPSRNVQVCSIQTYLSWKKRGKLAEHRPGIVVVDEAHRSMSPSYRAMVEEMIAMGVKILGITATPIVARGLGLGDLYDCMVKTPDYAELAAMGYLVLPKYYRGIIPDVSGIRLVGDDYDPNDLNAVMDSRKLVGDIVENWAIHSRGRPTIAFAAGVSHSMHIASLFNGKGIKAVHIDGETDKKVRDRANRDLGEGRIDVITNYGTHVEGTDIPPVSCIIDAAPTKSLMRYRQRGGRGCRTSPETGKTDFNYHDHSGNFLKHGRLEMFIDWQLCKGMENMEAHEKAMGMAKVERVCPTCNIYYTGKECPACGTPYVRTAEEMDIVPGVLELMTNDDVKQRKERRAKQDVERERQTFYLEALGWCRDHDKKPGMAAYAYEARYKEMPPRAWANMMPLTAGSDTTSYMRHRLIRAAKGLAKAKAQGRA